ncbi:hypothetical protein MNB_SUP05-13-25 [hydrothermal vent metagenome]|uniref:Uncharacterized protein n=1 Tax=hydrothermal vent metagenome TaxID=652676 RepID=A0A1W1DFL8_9ZZZZ
MITTIEAGADERRSAKAPHELFTINAMIVHLFFSLGMVKLFNLSMSFAIATSIALSLCIIAYTFFRTKKAKQNDAYLVYLHWQLSLNRYKLLIGAYVFYFIVISLSLVITSDAPASMDGSSIIDSILSLLGVVPLFFAVLVSVVLGSGSMFNAGRGEIDKAFMQKHPQ